MPEHHPHEDLLIRYADGLASQSERERADKLIKTDASAAKLYSILEQTQAALEPCRDNTLPDADQSVVDLIDGWQPSSTKTKRRFGVGAIAAALSAGLVAGHLISATVINQSNSGQMPSATTEHSVTPEWIRLVADYHRLYTRQTISDTSAPDINTVGNRVSEWLSRDTTIPDLGNSGIDFKRAQQLTVEDDMLVQLAYLPRQSNPLAVCIRKTDEMNNSPVKYNTYGGMRYAAWHDGNHAVVVVGDIGGQALADIVAQVKSTLFDSV